LKNECQSREKKKRLPGEQYVNTSSKVVCGKTFAAVTECCNKKYCEKFTLDEQNDSFISFFNSGSKSLQDSFLASCVKVKDTKVKRPTTDPKQNRVYTWTYILKTEGVVQEVCRKFIVQLFQVSMERVHVIQCKVTSNEGFEEKRGSHLNRSHKIDSNLWDLALVHLQTLPHRESHYRQQKSVRFCFENPNLTVVELFRLFQSYFLKNTGKQLKIAYKMYYEFFHNRCNFSFGRPKTDVCDFCVESEKKLASIRNDECLLEYKVHKKKAKAHDELRKDYMSRCKNDPTVLVVEFDYAHPKVELYLTVLQTFVMVICIQYTHT
jgi:hypothetical protein